MSTSKPRPAPDAESPANDDITCMPIEKCFEELETIVGALEDQTTSLEQSIALFERGMKLSKRCTTELARIEKKIQVIVENTRGEVQMRDFDTGPDSEA